MSELSIEEKYAQIEAIVDELADTHSNRMKRDALTTIKAIARGEPDPVAGDPEDEEGDETEEVDLSSFTAAELKAYAAEYEIDLGSARSKADILSAIEAAAESPEDETSDPEDEEGDETEV